MLGISVAVFERWACVCAQAHFYRRMSAGISMGMRMCRFSVLPARGRGAWGAGRADAAAGGIHTGCLQGVGWAGYRQRDARACPAAACGPRIVHPAGAGASSGHHPGYPWGVGARPSDLAHNHPGHQARIAPGLRQGPRRPAPAWQEEKGVSSRIYSCADLGPSGRGWEMRLRRSRVALCPYLSSDTKRCPGTAAGTVMDQAIQPFPI